MLHQDFLALDLPSARFDGVFANAALFHVPSSRIARVLADLAAALKPGGVLFCSNPRGANEEGWVGGRYGCFWDLATWRALVTAAGFSRAPPLLPPARPPARRAALARHGLAQERGRRRLSGGPMTGRGLTMEGQHRPADRRTMIFRQLYHSGSGTYTYLLGGRAGGEALIVDPVQEQVERYLTLLDELGLTLAKVVDTHVHADHISGMAELRDRTKCVTVMGREAPVDVVSMRVGDGDPVAVEGVSLRALHTPGHTAESYSFVMEDRVFTGDTLLIRGTGRTDFQNGDPLAQYDSLFGKLLTLPDETLVYPGHDYKGDTVSTIGEERRFNPRLQVACAADYAALMNALDLADPEDDGCRGAG